MQKEIIVDGIPVQMKSTGATYIKYRNAFHKDLFKELQAIGQAVQDGEQMPEGAVETLLRAAYIMAQQATPSDKRSFEEWLDQFSLLGSIENVQGVYALLLADRETLEEPKKKNDQPSAE